MEEKDVAVTEAKGADVVPAAPTAAEMVDQAFSAATAAIIQNDKGTQQDIMTGAGQVIQNETARLKSEAEKASKEAHFNNKKDACICFGFNETTTEKWAVSMMAAWHNVVTALWIFVGMFTFAPVVFLAKKIRVIIKTAWVAVLLAIVLYVAVALSPLWMRLLNIVKGV